MNLPQKALTILLAVSTLSLTAFAVNAAQDDATPAAPKGVKRWEYKYVWESNKGGLQMDIGDVRMPREQGLNYLGGQGWELIAHTPNSEAAYPSYVFKRELIGR
jgi:hypothetical protein